MDQCRKLEKYLVEKEEFLFHNIMAEEKTNLPYGVILHDYVLDEPCNVVKHGKGVGR